MYKLKEGYTLIHGIILERKYALSEMDAVMKFCRETNCMGIAEYVDSERSDKNRIELLYDTFTERDEAMEIAEKCFEHPTYHDPIIKNADYQEMMNSDYIEIMTVTEKKEDIDEYE